MKKRWFCFPVALCVILLAGCKGEKMDAIAAGYPEDIDPILRQTCATTGCHNAQSSVGAGGLNLETWEDLFAGSRGGSPVIPYSTENSFLLYTVNHDSTLGPVLAPTMPLNEDPLTSQQYYTLWHWINEGAKNRDGEERFAPDPNRKKYYVAHSECDAVAVFDAESRQIMRYIEVGNTPGTVEYIFDVQITPDGSEWWVVFFSSRMEIERYSTLTDEKIGEVPMGDLGWSNLSFSPDGKFAFVSNDYKDKFAVVDVAQNVLIGTPVDFTQKTRGPVVHPNRQQVYLAEQLGNELLVYDYDHAGQLSNPQNIDLVQHISPNSQTDLWPWQVLFLQEEGKYAVSCSNSNEVRFFDMLTDTLLEVIELPAGPSQMAWSPSTHRIFVSCMMDQASWGGSPGKLGSIVVLNTLSNQIEEVVYSGFQPYALNVDEENGVVAVANRNTDPTGPDPHHESPCGDRNGYLTLINLNTLKLIDDYKPELLVDPIIVTKKN